MHFISCSQIKWRSTHHHHHLHPLRWALLAQHHHRCRHNQDRMQRCWHEALSAQ